MLNKIREEPLIDFKNTFFEKILNVSNNWLWKIDEQGYFIEVSQAIVDLSGYSLSEILNTSFIHFLLQSEQSAFLNLFHQHQEIINFSISFQHKTKQRLSFDINALPVFKDSIFIGYCGIGINISRYKKIEENLRQSETNLADAQRIAHLGSWELDLITNELFWSDECFRILGHQPHSIKASYDYFIKAIHPDDLEMTLNEISAAMVKKIYDVQHRVILNNGKIGILHERGEVIFDENNTPVRMVGTTQNITELREAEQKIVQLMNYDFLTELPNRTMFAKQCEHLLSVARQNRQLCALFCLGLDRFKLVNESMGHDAGNDLLKAVANHLQLYPIDGDILARVGGDEFALMRVNVSHEDIAALLAQEIINHFATPFIVKGEDIVAGLSIGITLCPSDNRSVDELFKDAQTAMHRAKVSGGNTYQFYSSEMTAKVKHRLSLESHLRHALEKKEFLLYYQPKVSAKTGKITGAEALIRWQHPEKGLVSPTDFVSVLEDTGLIVPVGEWALQEICNQYERWRLMGFGDISLALNLSVKQFKDNDLCQKVARTLAKFNHNTDFLELEITESILMDDLENATKTLNNLNALGIKLSIDDFGTGYSSLAYIKLLPVDILKIDRSFIIGLPYDVQDNAIVKVIVMLAQALNLKVVAEGVETEEQLNFLIENHCDYIQGYYYSKPVPSTDFICLLRKDRQILHLQ
jgi:diguanylate cyclase (GGDEF)-like protein/PAS domain S-box-containing protein